MEKAFSNSEEILREPRAERQSCNLIQHAVVERYTILIQRLQDPLVASLVDGKPLSKTILFASEPVELLAFPSNLLDLPATYLTYADVFNKKEAETLLPHRTYVCHIILFPGSSPPRGHNYPLSQAETQAMSKYIKDNLARGFIRKSSSMAGGGKDVSLRSCIDYRRLNQITVKNKYPLLLLSKLFDRLNPYAPGRRMETVFHIRDGHYEYRVMLFGLCNIPAVFQELVNGIFQDPIYMSSDVPDADNDRERDDVTARRPLSGDVRALGGTRRKRVRDLVMVPKSNSYEVNKNSQEAFVPKGDWILVDITVQNLTYDFLNDGFSQVIYEVTLKRAAVIYIINLIIPACFLVFLDIASMFIQDFGERLGFKINVILGFSVLLLILNNMLPHSNSTPMLDWLAPPPDQDT
ncbi:unnamed protein product [Ranitomeya imitator]|uniref:Uncharacterized protein n=1 Tax=Ranitomeya imitator TaxID=111125 RepID=A0ABN9MI82_9NEOB|nr:unnamed protein product [Ranitomeya imitator]